MRVEGHRDELVAFDPSPIHPADGREPLRVSLAEAFDCLERHRHPLHVI